MAVINIGTMSVPGFNINYRNIIAIIYNFAKGRVDENKKKKKIYLIKTRLL